MSLGDDDRGDEGQSVLALVGDQDAQMLVPRQRISGSGGADSRRVCRVYDGRSLRLVARVGYQRLVLPFFGIALAISLVFVALGGVLG